MDFVKMQGLGNDFVVISGPVDPSAARDCGLVRSAQGIGADGVLEVTPLRNTRVQMRYWNADGGLAEMCGNGLRCVARYAADRGWVDSDTFIVETAVGPRPVRRSTRMARSAALLGTSRRRWWDLGRWYRVPHC